MKSETIETLLRDEIGLDPHSIGSRNILRAAIARQSACGLSDLSAYQQQLQASPDELAALIEAIVVPETWFFRDRKPFDALPKVVKALEFSPTNKRPLSILSLPCSTGEEPYSIAIALLDAGFDPNSFRIDAVDISRSAIARAKCGIYGKNSFRGGALQGREQYFQQTEEDYKIAPHVRQIVRFRQGNILDAFKTTRNRYNIIFCRNLLIYLDSGARTRVLAILERLLISPGFLFVGAVETAMIKTENFSIIPHSFALTYRKIAKSDEKRKGKSRNSRIAAVNHKPRLPNSIPTAAIAREDRTVQQSPVPAPLSTTPDLAIARDLADRGQLDRAAQFCQAYLQRQRSSAEAYLLLGEVHQAQGDDRQAERCFRKVLYLNPNSYEAVTHLILLQEYRGDRASVAILRQRLRRLQKSQAAIND